MTRNELYELEGKVVQNIDRIKAEQAEYIKGVEKALILCFVLSVMPSPKRKKRLGMRERAVRSVTLEKAKKLLEEEYERAKMLEWVHDPLAYALYQVWKKADTRKEREGNGAVR